MNILPRLGIMQLLLLLVWLSLTFSLLRESVYSVWSPQKCREIVVSPDGEYIALRGSWTSSIYHRSAPYASIPSEMDSVTSISFIDENTCAITASGASDLPQGIHFYSLSTRNFYRHFETNNTQRPTVLNDQIVVHEWNLQSSAKFMFFDMDAASTAAPGETYKAPTTSITASYTSDGKYAAFYWSNGSAEFLKSHRDGPTPGFSACDIRDEKTLTQIPESNWIEFSPDDSQVAVCDERISVYDWPSGKQKWSKSHEISTNIQFSKDGTKFGCRGLLSGCLRVFDTATGKQLFETDMEEQKGFGYAFSNDGKSVWCPSLDELGGIEFVNVDSGIVERRIGNSSSSYRWVLYYCLFLVWAFIFARTIKLRHSGSWMQFLCIWPGGAILMLFAICGFFSSAGRFWDGAFFGFVQAIQAMQLAISSSMLVMGFACFPKASKNPKPILCKPDDANHSLDSVSGK